MDEKDYKTVRKILSAAIPANLSDPHKDALRAKIKWGYEYSLGRRLSELVNRLSQDLSTRILGEPDGVPRSWIDTRNYYTHWDQNSMAGVLDEVEMHEAGVRLKCFLRALYLDLMGVSQKVIQQALSGFSDEAQYLIQINKRQRAAAAAAAAPEGIEEPEKVAEPETVAVPEAVGEPGAVTEPLAVIGSETDPPAAVVGPAVKPAPPRDTQNG
jgi:hypothetical protein